VRVFSRVCAPQGFQEHAPGYDPEAHAGLVGGVVHAASIDFFPTPDGGDSLLLGTCAQSRPIGFLPTPKGGGFPRLGRVHAASTLGGWRFTDRLTARSPRPVTARPAARMFFELTPTFTNLYPNCGGCHAGYRSSFMRSRVIRMT